MGLMYCVLAAPDILAASVRALSTIVRQRPVQTTRNASMASTRSLVCAPLVTLALLALRLLITVHLALVCAVHAWAESDPFSVFAPLATQAPRARKSLRTVFQMRASTDSALMPSVHILASVLAASEVPDVKSVCFLVLTVLMKQAKLFMILLGIINIRIYLGVLFSFV